MQHRNPRERRHCGKKAQPDTILLDVGLGAEDGRDVSKAIRKQFSNKIPIVLFSMKYDTLKELQDSYAGNYIKRGSTRPE